MADTTRSLDPLASREPLAFDDRARRIMELRRQVRQGTYRSDDRKIARAILDEWIADGAALAREQGLPPLETAADRREAAERFVVESTNEQAADAATLSA